MVSRGAMGATRRPGSWLDRGFRTAWTASDWSNANNLSFVAGTGHTMCVGGSEPCMACVSGRERTAVRPPTARCGRDNRRRPRILYKGRQGTRACSRATLQPRGSPPWPILFVCRGHEQHPLRELRANMFIPDYAISQAAGWPKSKQLAPTQPLRTLAPPAHQLLRPRGTLAPPSSP